MTAPLSRKKLDAAYAEVPFHFRLFVDRQFPRGRAATVKLWETGIGAAWRDGRLTGLAEARR